MAISSIHIEAGKGGYFAHNSREAPTINSVFSDEENFCSCSKNKAFEVYRAELEKRSAAYSNRTRQQLQKKTVTHLSAIVNFNKEHTPNDIKKICDHLENKLDTKVIQYAMHRDEGKSADDKNYHAHIEFMGLDRDGNSVRRKLDKKMLSTLQDDVAILLAMERGKNYAKAREKRPKRLDTYEYKEHAKKLGEEQSKATNLKRALTASVVILDKSLTPTEAGKAIISIKSKVDQEQIDEIAKKWEAVPSVEYNFRETQKQISALEALDAEQKKELHRLNTEINKIKAEDELKLLKIKELEERLIKMEETTLEAQNTPKEYKGTDEKEIEALRTENQTLSKDLQRVEKIYGQIEGLIEEEAFIEDLKALIRTHESYKPKSLAYRTAKERAQNAYRAKLGKPPLSVSHSKPNLQDSVEELKDVFDINGGSEIINTTVKR